MTTTKPYGYWSRNAQRIAQQAQTMTCAQLAKAHNATPKQMRNQLHILGIRCVSAKSARQQHLSQLCQQYTAAEIAELEGKTLSATYQELQRYQLKAKPGKYRKWNSQALDKLAQDAKQHTASALADLYGLELKYTYKLLRRFGIKTRPHRTVVPRSPKPKAAPKQRTAAAYTPVLRKPAQPAYALPQPKPQPEIIWPAHVQVQRITTRIPDNAPMCASTSRQPLVLGKNFCNGPRAI